MRAILANEKEQEMKRFITLILVNVASLWLIDRVMRTMYIGNANTLFFLAFILVILNATLKPLIEVGILTTNIL